MGFNSGLKGLTMSYENNKSVTNSARLPGEEISPSIGLYLLLYNNEKIHIGSQKYSTN